jgi:nucleoside 2-deoxyribosyltransferase
MRVFLAGIIQGSYQGLELHDQSYRDRLKDIFRIYLPDAETCCPIDMHPSGVDYPPEQQRQAFFELVETASQADLVVAYLPQASLGTAIEMWEAYHHGRPVVVITPMRENWVINLVASAVLPSIEAFERFVREGGLEDLTPLAPLPTEGRGEPAMLTPRARTSLRATAPREPAATAPAPSPLREGEHRRSLNGLPPSLGGKGGRGG